ncbi:MAG: hypothetical protein A4E73_01136 [Syntrophaceae bacterium PtaU1.Bin231]|nr:MAG: hypothetical protein A4E73_01136 [Syntrophaceae bacterium PtaU1.Bin231]
MKERQSSIPRGMELVRTKSQPVPLGMKPTTTPAGIRPSSPTRPLTTSLSVPSPPTQMIRSAPRRSCSPAARVASPGPDVRCSSKGPRRFRAKAWMRGHSMQVAPFPAWGFTMKAVFPAKILLRRCHSRPRRGKRVMMQCFFAFDKPHVCRPHGRFPLFPLAALLSLPPSVMLSRRPARRAAAMNGNNSPLCMGYEKKSR